MTTERDSDTRIVLSWLRDDTHENAERVLLRALDEVDTTPQRRPRWPVWRVAHMNRFGFQVAGAAVVAVVGALALAAYFDIPSSGVRPSPTSSASPTPQASGGMWPQTTLEAVRGAQERADAGDPDYTWQVDAQLVSRPDGELGEYFIEPGTQIAERFLREQLGWDAFLFNVYPTDGFQDDSAADGVIRGLVYSRCAPGETNPLYANEQEGPARGADRCAPTIDDLRYETVSIDLSQPDRRGPGGIWVVSSWNMRAPFAQADTRVLQAAAAARLQEFLQARIDGEGAEGYVNVSGPSDVPEGLLLYASTTGARYDRFEFELTGAQWPGGDLGYVVRLFADDGATMIEQQVEANGDFLRIDRMTTTENGQPVPQPFLFLDGQVSLVAPYPWEIDGDGSHWYRLDRGADRIEPMGNPLPIGEGCSEGAQPADAEALAQAIESDPNLVTTAPVAVTLQGGTALSMDVTVAPGASVCEEGTFVLTHLLGGNRRGLTLGEGNRMRLYLVDVPAGSSLGILAIAIVADDAEFDDVVADATPIIQTLAFHVP